MMCAFSAGNNFIIERNFVTVVLWTFLREEVTWKSFENFKNYCIGTNCYKNLKRFLSFENKNPFEN
jgi:hypothetical protein